MKLLFDENLSPKLVVALGSEYPGSAHPRTDGLRGATDDAIWEVARQEVYTIIGNSVRRGRPHASSWWRITPSSAG